MKKIILITLLMVYAIRAAELAPVAPLRYTILPRDVCALVAKYKTGYELFDVEKREDRGHYENHTHEQLRMSTTWNTATLIPDSHLMEHQLWFSDKLFRFDNDTTYDCNEFDMDTRIGQKEKIMFDGPNNDGGRHGGVILIARSNAPDENEKDKQKTEFYLFKQHNCDVRDYKGVMRTTSTTRAVRRAFNYKNFPYISAPLPHQSLDFCALAPHNRGLIATTDAQGVHHLHVFDYEYKLNDTNPMMLDQAFACRKNPLSASGVPLFTRLAWIYGRTLLGITNQNELYVVAIKEEDGKQPLIECFKQKTEKKFKNFCLRRPHDHHEVFLCDTENKLYSANLKRRTLAGAFVLKLIHGHKLNKAKAVSELLPVDRVWAYDNTLMTMNLQNIRCSLFTLSAHDNTEFINRILHEMKNKDDQQKTAAVQVIDNNPVQAFEEYTLTLKK